MDSLNKQILEILSLPRFANLNKEQKETVRECILANCLILSIEKQQHYLELIRKHLVSIEDLGEENYYKDNVCYGGIVETKIVRVPLDEEGMIYPLNYHLKYREYKEPIGRLTKSVLHEFGHMAVKKPTINLEDGKGSANGGLLMDMGGLIISESFNRDYGHAFCEIINEFTNFLAFKAYLSYTEIDINAIEKMKAFAQANGLKYEENINYLSILPDNLFTSFSEILSQKSVKFLNSPFSFLSSTIFPTGFSPTFLILPSPKRILPFSTVNFSKLLLISGFKISIPSSLHSSIYCGILSKFPK